MICVYLTIGFGAIALLVGIVFIRLSRRHNTKDTGASSNLNERNEWQKKCRVERIQLITGVVSCIFSGLSFLLAVVQLVIAIPAPLLTMIPSQVAGKFEVTAERNNYPFGEVYYRINQGAPVKYGGSFLVSPQDTVTAYISFLFWSGDWVEDTPRSPAITVRTVATLENSGDVVLRCETITGDTSSKSIPLYRSDPDNKIEIIDVEGVARLTISAEDLRRLFHSGGTGEVTATVVVENPDDLQSIVEVTLTGNGQSIDCLMQNMVLYLPQQENNPNKTVAQWVREPGTFEADIADLIPRSVADGKIIAIPLISSGKLQIVSRDAGFTDVPVDDKAVNFVGSHGILRGTGDGRFSPQTDITRGGAVTALYNMTGNPWAELGNWTYLDVPKDSWCAQAIAWASEEEIIIGTGGNQFYPDMPVTRGQFALMFWRYSGKPAATSNGLPKYDDLVHVKGDEYTALCWMLQEGILTDAGDNLIRPEGRVAREEAAIMLMRLCGWFVGMDVG